MKKIFTFAISFALCTSLYAESIKIFKCEKDGIPGMTEPQLMGFSISANGKYICGTIEQGAGIFSADVQTGEVKWEIGGEAGSELRGIDDNGLATGFIDDEGVLFSFNTGEISNMKAPAGFRYVQGEGLSNDGSVKVGALTLESFNTVAAYSNGNDEWRKLPYPSDAQLGNLKENIAEMSAAKYVSGDGKVILGHLGSFSYPIVWTMNDEGEYIPDFYPGRLVKAVEADRYDESKPLYAMSGFYTCMSNNGKYIGSIAAIANESNTETRIVPVIYNTVDKSMKIYKEYQNIDELGLGLYPRAIADDGTFVGTISQPSTPAGNYGAFIMKAGKEQAELFIEAFPEFNDTLGESDLLGQNVPTGISADGKNILGYTFYSDDYDLSSDAPAYFVTYVISLDETGVNQMSSAQSLRESIYSVDGRKLGRMEKGLNIIRKADGSVTKILKK